MRWGVEFIAGHGGEGGDDVVAGGAGDVHDAAEDVEQEAGVRSWKTTPMVSLRASERLRAAARGCS